MLQKRWILLLGLLVTAVPVADIANADAALTAREFTAAYIDAVTAERPELEVKRVGPLDVDLIDADGQTMQVGLDNAYRQYQNYPAGLDEIIANHVASIRFGDSVRADPSRNSIRPVIKSDDYLESLREMMAEQGVDSDLPLPIVELAGDLNVLFVIDTETTMSTIDHRTAEELALSRDDLLAVATSNLAAFFEEIQVSFEALETHQGGTILYLVADGNYEASALLLDPVLTALDEGLQGDVVVFVPARDLFMATGTAEPGGIAAATEVAKRLYEESAYVISPHGYERSTSGWTRHRQ